MGPDLSSNDIYMRYPGFGFRPTNQELIDHFLKPKIAGNASVVDKIIVTIDNINRRDPAELPGLCSKPWNHGPHSYFFCQWNKYVKGKGVDRVTEKGSWKLTGKELKIKGLETDEVIGRRNILVFYKGRASRATKTGYTIHLYEITNPSSADQTEPFVLCRMHYKAAKGKKNKADAPNKVDLEMQIPPDVIPPVEGNGIGEQNNALFSQSPDSILLDADGLSNNETSNADTPVPIAGAQEEYCPWDQTEMLDSESLEDMMKKFYVPEDGDYHWEAVDNGVDGEGNSQVFRPSADSLLPDGGKVLGAPTATEAFEDQPNHDPQFPRPLSPDNYWEQFLSGGEFPPDFESSGGSFCENLHSYTNHFHDQSFVSSSALGGFANSS